MTVYSFAGPIYLIVMPFRRFSAKTREEIQAALHLPAIHQYDKYLGLPSLVGRSKHATFAHLKERVWTKMQGWKERLLSQVGREVLIKAVIQAIPTYTMNCFKLPKKLCLELERLIRNFWWGHTATSRKVHWVKWSSLCQPKSMGGMGFRDLAKFNDALLAKQVWRLVHNKTSLLYKVFKAKFFPRGTIMEARCPASASFAWKSIFQARHVIRKGARWRVGNGNSIRIWHDRWIPIPFAGVPVTPPNELPEDACVSSLIQVDTGLWNKELVELVFIPSEASLILSTTLSSRAPNDLIVWGGEKSGKYSVRSAYRMLATVDLDGNPGCSTTEYWRMFWKKIWSVKVPFKIRNFLWRVCIDALPTLVKLQRRTIISTARCSFCLAEDEDIMHALWTCPLLMPLWTHHKLTRKAVRSCYTSLLDVVGHLLEYESDASLAKFAFMLWLVWQRRNKAMYQSELNNLDDIPLLAQRLLLEFWAVNDQQQSVPQVIPKQAWQPPTQFEFKANCDAALFPSHNMTSVGVVIRDGRGLPIATLCKRFHCLHAVDDAEAIAVREAVQLARDVGLAEVEVEGDSLVILHALKQQEVCFASYGDIIQDIHQLACSLDRVVFSHVRRTENRVTHVLARNAIGLSSDFLVWLEDVPPFLEDVIQSEFSPF
uniref:RNase H type-1 domain-containing protein n=1 Tax=Fagus sylvatica TaxID=28930 RepID=A0A2N9EM29_FAGSY